MQDKLTHHLHRMKPEIKSTTNPNVFFANIVADQVEGSSFYSGCFVREIREFNRIQRSLNHPNRDYRYTYQL